jgi:hypothetical protein
VHGCAPGAESAVGKDLGRAVFPKSMSNEDLRYNARARFSARLQRISSSNGTGGLVWG